MAKNEDQQLPQDLKNFIDGDQAEPVKLDQEGKTKAFLFGGLASVVLVGGILFAGSLGNNNDNAVAGPVEPNNSSSNNSDDTEATWYDNGPEAIVPIKLPEWAMEEKAIDANTLTDEEKAYFAKQIENTNLGELVTVGLLSEEEGYTTDFAQATDKNGFPNPMFTSMSEELFASQSGFILQKLLNPLYGGWGEYQFSSSSPATNFDSASIAGLFSEKYLLEHQGQSPSSWPIYADWKGNDYGMKDELIPSGDARWFGDVTSATVDFKYNKALLGYEARAVYKVKFLALTKTKDIVSKDGVLTIDYVPNLGAKTDDKQLRLLIDNASLVVK